MPAPAPLPEKRRRFGSAMVVVRVNEGVSFWGAWVQPSVVIMPRRMNVVVRCLVFMGNSAI